MTAPAHVRACSCRECCLDRAAQAFVDGIAERDAMTPHDAAVAAGARTPEQIDALAERIRRDREHPALAS